jgi:hypothetical protein
MFGRVKDAMADAAETLRQTFAGLKVVEVTPEPFDLRSHGSPALAVDPRAGLEVVVGTCREMPQLKNVVQDRALEPFRAQLCDEAGWARWGAEAEVVRMTPLEAGAAARIAVPPLPRKAQVQGRMEPLPRPGVRLASEPLTKPGVRRMDPGLAAATAESGMKAMLALAVPIQGEDIQRLAKGLWMRYSLQLVRGTGENVRNLEVLGLFQIPRKGLTDLRHDPKNKRILVQLDPAAVRSPRAPFILARRKDDGSLVTCFVEDP